MTEEMQAKSLGAAVVALTAYVSGISWGLLLVLVIFQSIDYITGVMKAIMGKKLDSGVGRNGLFRKIYVLILVLVVVLLEYAILSIKPNTPWLFYGFLSVPVMSWYIFQEVISILENGIEMRVPIPPIIKEVLAKFHPTK